MATVNDAKFAALRNLGFTGSITDMTLQWLQSEGATSGAIPDAWHEALLATGLVTEPFHNNDAWFAVLGIAGFIGSINDRELSFWENYTGGPIGGQGYQSDDNGFNFVNYDAGVNWFIGQNFEINIEMVWSGVGQIGNTYLFRFGEIGSNQPAEMSFAVGFGLDGSVAYAHIAENAQGTSVFLLPFGRVNTVVTVRYAFNGTTGAMERSFTTEDGDSDEFNDTRILTSRVYGGTNVMIFAETAPRSDPGMFVRNARMSIAGVEVVNATCQEGSGLISVNTGTGADGVISRESVHIGVPFETVVDFTMDVGDAVPWIGYDSGEGTGDMEPKDIPGFPLAMANFRSNRTSDVSTMAFSGTRNQDVDAIAVSFDGGPSVVLTWAAAQSRYDLSGSVAMRDFLLANLGEQVTGTLTYEL